MGESPAVLKNKLTNATTWFMSGAGSRCDYFEKAWMDCASQLGVKRAEIDCKNIIQDKNECYHSELAYKRYQRIQEERQKKGLPFQEPPPYDTLMNQKFKTVVF
jgi:hypothetical protein